MTTTVDMPRMMVTCVGCWQPIHRDSCGTWLDGEAMAWCPERSGVPHKPMSITQQVAHDTLQEDRS